METHQCYCTLFVGHFAAHKHPNDDYDDRNTLFLVFSHMIEMSVGGHHVSEVLR